MISMSFSLSFRAAPVIMIVRLVFLLYGVFAPAITVLALRNVIDSLVLLNIEQLTRWFVLLCTVQILTIFINKVAIFISTLHGDKISLIISTDIIDNICKLDISYFEDPATYDELINASRDINSMPSIIWNVLSSLQAITQLIIVCVMLASFAWYVPLVICLVSLPGYIVDRKISLELYDWNRGVVNEVRKMNYSYDTLISRYYSKDIRIKNLYSYLRAKYIEQWRNWFFAKKKLITKHFIMSFLLIFLPHISIIGFSLVVVASIFAQENTTGDFMFYSGLMSQVAGGIFSIVATMTDLIQQKVKVDNYMKFKSWKPRNITVDYAASNIEFNQHEIKELKSIEFRNVSFSYPNTNILALDNVSFVIYQGEKVGFVGRNGSGKTTVVKLLLGLYIPTKGEIFVNDIPLKQCKINLYQNLFSEMMQDYVNYSFPLYENIIMADINSKHTDERIEKACKLSDIYSLVNNWKHGIHSSLTKGFDVNGVELSGGEWQKIALARFFYREAQFYLMDEPASSLDADSEEYIFKSVFDKLKDKTLLLISHRLSNIKIMDKILVFDMGKVIEIGTHDQLLSNDKLYTHLYGLQASKY